MQSTLKKLLEKIFVSRFEAPSCMLDFQCLTDRQTDRQYVYHCLFDNVETTECYKHCGEQKTPMTFKCLFGWTHFETLLRTTHECALRSVPY